jgi:hypothetical protein
MSDKTSDIGTLGGATIVRVIVWASRTDPQPVQASVRVMVRAIGCSSPQDGQGRDSRGLRSVGSSGRHDAAGPRKSAGELAGIVQVVSR